MFPRGSVHPTESHLEGERAPLDREERKQHPLRATSRREGGPPQGGRDVKPTTCSSVRVDPAVGGMDSSRGVSVSRTAGSPKPARATATGEEGLKLGPCREAWQVSSNSGKRNESRPAVLQHARATREKSRRGGERPRGRRPSRSTWRWRDPAEAHRATGSGSGGEVGGEAKHHEDESSREVRTTDTTRAHPAQPLRWRGWGTSLRGDGIRAGSVDERAVPGASRRVASDTKDMGARPMIAVVVIVGAGRGTDPEGHPGTERGREGGWEPDPATDCR